MVGLLSSLERAACDFSLCSELGNMAVDQNTPREWEIKEQKVDMESKKNTEKTKKTFDGPLYKAEIRTCKSHCEGGNWGYHDNQLWVTGNLKASFNVKVMVKAKKESLPAGTNLVTHPVTCAAARNANESSKVLVPLVAVHRTKKLGPARFIHIPKAGGTTFSMKLQEAFGSMGRPPYFDEEETPTGRQPLRNSQAPSKEITDSGKVWTLHGYYTGVRYAYLFHWMGTWNVVDDDALELLPHADVISVERDASWLPAGRVPSSKMGLLRRPTCRALSHFFHHRDRRNAINSLKCANFTTLDDYLTTCCQDGWKRHQSHAPAPGVSAKCASKQWEREIDLDKDLCGVDCRQFTNFQV